MEVRAFRRDDGAVVCFRSLSPPAPQAVPQSPTGDPRHPGPQAREGQLLLSLAGSHASAGRPQSSDLRALLRYHIMLALHTGECGRVCAEATHQFGFSSRAVVLDQPPASFTDGRLERHPLTVVCVDPRFGARVCSLRAGVYRDRIRIVLADDEEAVETLDRDEPVFLTRAARERLGSVPFRLLVPHSPAFDVAFARDLSRVLIGLNLGVYTAGR